jgi:glucoamylase
MSRRAIGSLWVHIAFIAASASAPAFAALPASLVDPAGNEAPHPQEAKPSLWSSGVKQAFGTAYEAYDPDNAYSERSPTAPLSKTWFTIAQGILTETYWPSIDNPQIRDSQILVTDGSTFLYEERKDSETTIEWVKSGVPAFKIRNRDPQHRFEIERVIFTDPDRDVVVQKIRISRYVEGLHFYLLHNPSVANTPLGNSALASDGREGPGAGLFAWQGDQAQAVLFSIPLKAVSAGFALENDGWSDLDRNKKLTKTYSRANFGDVVLTAELDVPASPGASDLDIVIGFGRSIDSAYQVADASLSAGTARLEKKYVSQWQAYQGSIRDLGGVANDGGKLFRGSIAVMKSAEDKTAPGAFVASPAVPWGLHSLDWNSEMKPGGRCANNRPTVGYHLVWPRDLYQMATSFMAVDDPRSAIASLNFLKSIQYTSEDGEWHYSNLRHRAKDGSFPQNVWTSGETCWSGLQMDEVAMPVILAYRLWKEGHVEAAKYWDMVRRAADFVQAFGPWSPMERWEETQGISPSTVGAQITALWAAAELADAAKDTDRAKLYRATADSWSSKPGDNIDAWTYTTTGGHGNGKYYVRIEAARSTDQVWDPNDDAKFWLPNHGGEWREKDVVDGGFLELVRFGIRPALDRHIRDSVVVYDQTIRTDVGGKYPGFNRYLGDRYNYNENTGEEVPGALWPFLSGERGHYELQKALEQGKSTSDIDAAMSPYIVAMEAFATPSLMLPEQVYATGPQAGGPTGAATPLGWTHGEYVKLLRSRSDRQIFDRLSFGARDN